MTKHLGSISSGTLKPFDLLHAFANYLDEHMGDIDASDRREAKEIVADSRFMLAANEWLTNSDLDDSEAMSTWEQDTQEIINERLIPMLESFALPYCDFGTSEGDGSDFGFWIDMDRIEEDVYDGELIKLGALDVDKDATDCLAVEINDHGNVTLWQLDGEGARSEVWSIVQP